MNPAMMYAGTQIGAVAYFSIFSTKARVSRSGLWLFFITSGGSATVATGSRMATRGGSGRSSGSEGTGVPKGLGWSDGVRAMGLGT
jgi:hypothetical protein